MLETIKFEWAKQRRRRENLLLLVMLLIPLFYAVGVASGSSIITYTSTEAVNGLSFATSMFGLVYMLWIVNLFVAINSANTLRGEMDSGSISIMLTRINDRGTIYDGKLYAQIVNWIVVTGIFVLFSLGCYYALIARLPIADGSLFGAGAFGQILTLLALCSSYVLTMSFVQCVSMYTKSYVAVGLFMLGWVLCLFIKEFPVIQYLSPLYHINELIDSGRAADFIRFMLLNWGGVVFFTLLGHRKFKIRDL